jgi:hypothetical protein
VLAVGKDTFSQVVIHHGIRQQLLLIVTNEQQHKAAQ